MSEVRRAALTLLLPLIATAAALLAPAGRATVVPDAPLVGQSSGFLSECSLLSGQKLTRCYVRGLLAEVERSGDPANELPRIDAKARATGGVLATGCHGFMHEVGRAFANRHHITLATLQRYVPRSNDPGCSAGFGMGLVMHFGTKLVVDPPSALAMCTRLPTRFRRYTCVHGLGHAFMRGYHGQLRAAVSACRMLGARNAPDCSQGAFHDYWVSLRGADGTTRPENAELSPRALCDGRLTFVRACWYRYFWEREPSRRLMHASEIPPLCKGLTSWQRAGCVAGASLLIARERQPVDHAENCSVLGPTDALNCLRGVVVPAVSSTPADQIRLIRTCTQMPRAAIAGCQSWFGRTLTIVTDGRFARTGCPRLATAGARAACRRGAAAIEQPLQTFS